MRVKLANAGQLARVRNGLSMKLFMKEIPAFATICERGRHRSVGYASHVRVRQERSAYHI
jgi:hypothetical protein